MKMFAAFVIVLIATSPSTLKDARGPYTTLKECKERTIEIARDVTAMRIPNVKVVGGYCRSTIVKTRTA